MTVGTTPSFYVFRSSTDQFLTTTTLPPTNIFFTKNTENTPPVSSLVGGWWGGGIRRRQRGRVSTAYTISDGEFMGHVQNTARRRIKKKKINKRGEKKCTILYENAENIVVCTTQKSYYYAKLRCRPTVRVGNAHK